MSESLWPATPGPAERRVVILVGTDHHPFERAVIWADARQRSHPEERVVIQHGQTSAPSYAEGAAFLSQDELYALIAGATVVVTHGGPGTINDARSGGHRPLVLPRNPAHGEHVDDHQMRFAAWCGERGLVRLVADLDALDALVAGLGERGTRESLVSDQIPPGVGVLQAMVAAPRLSSRPVLPGSPVLLSVGAAAAPVTAGQLADAFLDVEGALVLGSAAALPALVSDPLSVCACGKPVEDCVLWSEVLDQVDPGDPEQALPGLPAVARRHLPRRDRSRLLARTAVVRRLVTAALEVTGARFVVDGGDLAAVLALGHDGGFDLRVVAPPGQGPRGAAAVAALRHRRLPVLSMSGRPSAAVVVRRVASLPLPAGGQPTVDHGPDARLSRA